MASGKKATGISSNRCAVCGLGANRDGAFSDGSSYDVAKWVGDNGADDAVILEWMGATVMGI